MLGPLSSEGSAAWAALAIGRSRALVATQLHGSATGRIRSREDPLRAEALVTAITAAYHG